MQDENVNAIGYIRTAIFDPAGDKLNDQAKMIVSYCEKNNLNLMHIFKDNGASGLDFNRKGWNELRNEVRKSNGSIRFLIVPNYDRISRNMFTASGEIEKLKNDFGIEVCPTNTSVDLKDTFRIFHTLPNSSEKPRRNRRRKRH